MIDPNELMEVILDGGTVLVNGSHAWPVAMEKIVGKHTFTLCYGGQVVMGNVPVPLVSTGGFVVRYIDLCDNERACLLSQVERVTKNDEE